MKCVWGLLFVAVLCGAPTAVFGADGDLDAACIAPGNTCTDSTNHVCDTQRASALCKIQAGKTCTANPSACVAGATCDSTTTNNCVCGGDTAKSTTGLCELEPGESCASDAFLCKADNTCQNNVCKVNVGTSCTGAAALHCVTGAVCDSSSTQCKLDFGGDCTANAAHCKSGSTCDSAKKCKLAVAGDCSGGNSGNCPAGTTCDNNKCKLNAGESCTSPNAANCKSGTICESNVCKLDFNGDCSGASSSHCKAGTICDALSLCRIAQTGDCTSNQDKCASGGTCTNNACACTTALAPVSGTFCAPVAKKVGGSCNSADGASACDDANAECTSSKCVCKTNFTPDSPTLTCKSGAEMTAMSTLLLTVAALMTSRLF